MKGFIGLVKRNILVYIKDKQTVFFSILTPLLVFLLYVLFLRGTFVNGLNNSLGEAKEYIDSKDIDIFANLILLAGVIGSSVITVSYSTLTTIISDKEAKIDYDISATPIKRPLVILSYVVSGFINSFIISSLLLTASLIVVSGLNETYLEAFDILKLYGFTALGSLSSTAFLMIIVMCFKTTASSGAFQGLLCASTGFLIGAYIPISEFDQSIQTIANILPGSHIAALFRDTLLSGVINHMDNSINGIDSHMVKTSLEEAFSLKLNMFNNIIPSYGSIIYIAVLFILSSCAVVALYNKLYKRN